MLSQMQQFTLEQRTALMGQLVRARQQQQQVRVKCSLRRFIDTSFRVNSPVKTAHQLTLIYKVTQIQIWVLH